MKPSFKNIRRNIFEYFMLRIYIFAPLVTLLLYYLVLVLILNFNLSVISTFNETKIEISLTITSILLTIMGLFASLPNTEFRVMMKKYGHDKIINGTLFIGVISSLLLILFAVSEVCIKLQVLLFLISVTETFVASIWLYKTLKHINS